MKLFIFLLIFSFLIPSALTVAQDSEEDEFDFGVAIMPQYAFASTMRFDFDFTLKNKNVLTVAPLFSFARNSSLLFSGENSTYYDDDYYEDDYPQDISLTGGGVKLVFRHFFGDFINNSGAYVGGGLHYRYSHVKYKINDWMNTTEDGDEYIVYGTTSNRDDFNQFGVDFLLGYQLLLGDNIFGDVFAGWGFRISDSDSEDTYWNETIFDLAYSGYTPLVGFRLGLFF